MKKNSIKKVLSIILITAMCLSMAACSKTKDLSADVIDAADKVSSAIKNGDEEAFTALCADPDSQDSMFFDYNSDDNDLENAPIMQAIADTVSYTVNEDSCEIDEDTASIDVDFSVVDFEAVWDIEENRADMDTYIAALEACDETVDTTVTLEFSLEDEEWLLVNDNDVLNEVVTYTDIVATFEFDLALCDCIEDCSVVGAENGCLLNAESVEIDITPTEEGLEADWTYYYTISCTNNDSSPDIEFESYCSDVITDYSTACIEIEIPSEFLILYNGYIVGDYQVYVYDSEDNMIATVSFSATYSEGPTFIEENFEDGAFVTYVDDSYADHFSASWSDDNGTSDSFTLSADATVISCDVSVTDLAVDGYTYNYFFVSDGSELGAMGMMAPLFDENVAFPAVGDDGLYSLELDMSIENLAGLETVSETYFLVLVYDADGNPVMVAYCYFEAA